VRAHRFREIGLPLVGVCAPRRQQPCSHGEPSMPTGQIDPAHLKGEALWGWYQRTPDEIEQQRQAAAADQYAAFFGPSTGQQFAPVQRSSPVASPPRQSPASLSSQPIVARFVAAGREEGARYGSLRAPPPGDLAKPRQEQAEFERTRRDISKENSWMAIPALAPAAVVLGLGGAAAWGARALGPRVLGSPLNLVEREVWQKSGQRAGQALSEEGKAALRREARVKFARANGKSASDMRAEVHHSDPLEWAHLKPSADPNRLANLWGLRGEAHEIATRAWAEFRKSLNGRMPTPAELMEAKLRIDRLVEPYIRRAGVPRSNKPPRKGGPI
jgi:hypothetical protein